MALTAQAVRLSAPVTMPRVTSPVETNSSLEKKLTPRDPLFSVCTNPRPVGDRRVLAARPATQQDNSDTCATRLSFLLNSSQAGKPCAAKRLLKVICCACRAIDCAPALPAREPPERDTAMRWTSSPTVNAAGPADAANTGTATTVSVFRSGSEGSFWRRTGISNPAPTACIHFGSSD